MYYLPNDTKQPAHKNFKHYKTNYTTLLRSKGKHINNARTLMFLKLGLKYSNIQKLFGD